MMVKKVRKARARVRTLSAGYAVRIGKSHLSMDDARADVRALGHVAKVRESTLDEARALAAELVAMHRSSLAIARRLSTPKLSRVVRDAIGAGDGEALSVAHAALDFADAALRALAAARPEVVHSRRMPDQRAIGADGEEGKELSEFERQVADRVLPTLDHSWELGPAPRAMDNPELLDAIRVLAASQIPEEQRPNAAKMVAILKDAGFPVELTMKALEGHLHRLRRHDTHPGPFQPSDLETLERHYAYLRSPEERAAEVAVGADHDEPPSGTPRSGG